VLTPSLSGGDPFPAVMRPSAAAVRPWHPSELARLGRNAVEDPPQAGCLGRTAAAPWRISRRGWASACDGRGGRGGCRRRTTQPIEATGSHRSSAGILAARSLTGHELTPLPLAPREGSSPEGPRRRRRLGHAAVFGRVIEPDPTEGRGTPKHHCCRESQRVSARGVGASSWQRSC
jgi:hypothetical protein